MSRYARQLSLAAALVAILLILAATEAAFFRSANLRNIAVGLAPALMAAIGMTFIIVARQIDVSVGAQFCICGVVAGLIAKTGAPWPVIAAGAIASGAILGAINGFLVTRLNLPSIVVSLATMVIWRESLRWIRQGEFVRDLPQHFQWFGFSQEVGQITIMVLALGTLVVLAWTAQSLYAGRAIFAAGSDPEAARLAGINVPTVVLASFILMGILSAAAALLNAVRFSDVDPNAGTGLEMQAIAAAVVGGAAITGGRGSLLGTLLGVALLGLIGPALVFIGIQPQWEKALQGLIILIAVAADPQLRRSHA